MDASDRCFVGEDKVKWSKVKRSTHTHSTQMTEYSNKITWGYWPSEERYYALRSMERSHCKLNFR